MSALSIEERRARLERRANVIRSRLLRTLGELDDRRHQVTSIAEQGRKLAVPAAVALAGGAILAAGVVFGLRKLFARKVDRSLLGQAKTALAQLHIERRPSIFEDAMRKLVVTSVGILGAEVARRSAKRIFEGRPPIGLLPSHDPIGTVRRLEAPDGSKV